MRKYNRIYQDDYYESFFDLKSQKYKIRISSEDDGKPFYIYDFEFDSSDIADQVCQMMQDSFSDGFRDGQRWAD